MRYRLYYTRVIGMGRGVGVDQNVVAAGYRRHYYENMSMLE